MSSIFDEKHKRSPACSRSFGSESFDAEKESLRDELLIGLIGAVSAEPEVSENHIALGRRYLEVGEPVLARLAFEDALVLRPDSTEALKELAQIKSDQGRTQPDYYDDILLGQIAELYERVVNVDPCDADAWRELGIIRYEQLYYALADEALSTARRFTPTDCGTNYHLGLTNQKMAARSDDRGLSAESADYYIKAGQYFSVALSNCENDDLGSDIRVELGRMAIATNDPESAKAHFMLALETRPDNVLAYDLLYLTCYKQGVHCPVLAPFSGEEANRLGDIPISDLPESVRMLKEKALLEGSQILVQKIEGGYTIVNRFSIEQSRYEAKLVISESESGKLVLTHCFSDNKLEFAIPARNTIDESIPQANKAREANLIHAANIISGALTFFRQGDIERALSILTVAISAPPLLTQGLKSDIFLGLTNDLPKIQYEDFEITPLEALRGKQSIKFKVHDLNDAASEIIVRRENGVYSAICGNNLKKNLQEVFKDVPNAVALGEKLLQYIEKWKRAV